MQDQTMLSKKVLVTGATGQQGGAVARALLAKGHFVQAMTRKADSPAAVALEKKGAQIVTASFDDPESLERAAKGTDAVFAMGTPFEAGADEETRQSIALIDAVHRAGTKHIVYTSVGNADKNTGIPHFDSKYRVEQHLATLDGFYTILGPVWFMENALGPYVPELKQGRLPVPMPPDRPLQQVALENAGQVAAAVIDAGEHFHGRRIDLACDELSCSRMAEIIGKVSGKVVEFVEVPLADMMGMNEDLGKMFEWFSKVGYSADIDALKSEFAELDWMTFEDWARGQDWSAIQS